MSEEVNEKIIAKRHAESVFAMVFAITFGIGFLIFLWWVYTVIGEEAVDGVKTGVLIFDIAFTLLFIIYIPFAIKVSIKIRRHRTLISYNEIHKSITIHYLNKKNKEISLINIVEVKGKTPNPFVYSSPAALIVGAHLIGRLIIKYKDENEEIITIKLRTVLDINDVTRKVLDLVKQNQNQTS